MAPEEGAPKERKENKQASSSMDAMKNSPSLQRLGQETQDLVRPSQEGAFKSTAATAASPQVAGRAGSKVEQEEENTAASAASPQQVACRAELCSPPKGVEVPQTSWEGHGGSY